MKTIYASLFLLLLFFTPYGSDAGAESDCPYNNGEFYLMRSAAQKVKANLEFAIRPDPKNKIHHWILYAACPPVLERQFDLDTSLDVSDCKKKVEVVNEASPQKRPVYKLKLDSKQEIPILSGRLKLSATLNRCRLIPRSKESSKTGDALSTTEKQNNLAATFSLDYKTEAFQNFLKAKKLRKKNNEIDLCFAFRVFNELRGLYRYHWTQNLDRRVSKTCLKGVSDCAGLSYLYCAVLRANGIPARTLIGRIARSTNRVEDFSASFSCHAKSEVFIEKIGWIPADLSEAVSLRRRPAEDFFGVDHGNFIVMHVNPDLVLDTQFQGSKTIRSMPDFRFWIAGADGKALDNAAPRRIMWTVDNTLIRN